MSSRVKEDVQKLFEFWCEVTKAESGNVLKQAGHIIESFPEGFKDEQIIGKIPEFAYPCEFENESVQTYSFVLTSDDSKWRFGFCRHDPKTQTAMVIITYLPWHDTFLRLLGVLGELRRKNNGEFELFLSEAYSKGVPEPGASLKLFFNAGENHFIFQRPSQFQLPSIPENHNLNLYYNFVDPKNMISVFAAMLSERRIIFTSRRLDKLSSCIQAANAFLYPMVWQHIFIPVLPMKLKDILSAPMPYLIGVPEAVLETMTPEELGEVVILNCDKKLFESPFDDVQEMPPDLVHQMKKSLSNPHDHIGDRVSRIFLIALVQLIGGYRDAVRFPYGQKIQWDQKAFIESRPPHLRSFLARMMELQIFQQFIEDRIQMLSSGLGLSDEFELETLKQAEKMNKRGRNYKEFLRNVKDKTNPAVKSAVKSVKEGSRGVKTAYKDLKSKFRDVTPPKSQFHIQTSLGYNYSGTSGYHRSAPNSPVISRRQTTPDYNVINNHGGTLPIGTNEILFLTTSASNSYLENGYSTDHNIVNNNNLNLSPTISPSSSLCSSDMNLTQELQNHPLFKSPVVDRSLKPSGSLDSGRLNSARYGSAIRAPTTLLNTNSQTNKIATHNEIEQSDIATARSPLKNYSAQNILDVPMGNLCIVDLDETEENKEDLFAIVTTNSIFDIPPDMPSPPVPPPRSNSNRNINKVISRNNNINMNHGKRLEQENSDNKNFIGDNITERNKEDILLNEFENNFVDHNTVAKPMQKNIYSVQKKLSAPNNEGKSNEFFCIKPPPSRPNRSAHHISIAKQQQQQLQKKTINNEPIPIPTPRQKPKESSQSLQTPTAETPIDLINLEDGSSSSNNTSFEIEDFDPLNQNAKPIPQLKLDIPTQSSPIRPVSIPTSIVIGSSRKSPIPQLNNIGKVIPTSTAAMSSSIPSYISNSMNKSTLCNTDSNSIAGCTIPPIHGPVLPYFTPQHNQHNRNQQGIAQILNNGINNVKNEGDDEIELLRKYGLDQFTLNKNGKNEVFGEKVLIKNSDILVNGIDNRDGSNSVANSINSWTTFD
ncbi:DENN domain-containing protein 1C isoform X2 [Condylostylus longicornis]|uniref:DENN domain-containing protein 1C isoform X2 n=1 Tax=Condylostylus longicornis TaxID=2530218 RepID=UPI00244E210D|nr:DENN domain-containing protein 1C isoform X2 [Condylostylus longicornis]